MIVERKNDEIWVRFSAGIKASRIQAILDYLRYEEITAQSVATEKDVESLNQEAKSGRWEQIKNEIGFHD